MAIDTIHLDPEAGLVVVTAALGFLASQLPTRFALRAQPADAIGPKE